MFLVRTGGALCGALALACAASPALADTHATLDVTAGARYARNPFLITGTSVDSGAATIEAKPTVEVTDETSTLSMTGAARLDQYFQHYGTDFTALADVAYDRHFSETNHFRLAGAFSTSRGGSRELGQPALGGPNPPVINPGTDVTVAGNRFRQYYYGGNGRLFLELSRRTAVELGGGVTFYDPKLAGVLSYRTWTADGGVTEALSETAKVGAEVVYSHIDYRHQIAGDTDSISPRATANLTLSEKWTLTGNAGVAFVSTKQAVGPSIKNTGFVGTATLCNQGETVKTCLLASRGYEPTALAGVSTVTSISLQQDWRFSDRDTLNLSGRYGETDQPAISVIQFGANHGKLVTATASYARQLTERLFFVVTPQFEKAWGLVVYRRANYELAGTLRYRFGE